MSGAGLYIAPSEKDPFKQTAIIRQLIEGRSNAVGSCTMTVNAASTKVIAATCGAGSGVFIQPITANAASVSAVSYVSSVIPGAFWVTTASNANSDKSFFYVCLG